LAKRERWSIFDKRDVVARFTGSWFRGVAYTYVAARARAEGSPPGQTLFN